MPFLAIFKTFSKFEYVEVMTICQKDKKNLAFDV